MTEGTVGTSGGDVYDNDFEYVLANYKLSLFKQKNDLPLGNPQTDERWFASGGAAKPNWIVTPSGNIEDRRGEQMPLLDRFVGETFGMTPTQFTEMFKHPLTPVEDLGKLPMDKSAFNSSLANEAGVNAPSLEPLQPK